MRYPVVQKPEFKPFPAALRRRHCPAGAVGFREQGLRGGVVRDAELRGVPGEGGRLGGDIGAAFGTRRERDAGGDVAELHGFAERTGIVEARARATAFENGVDPRVVVVEAFDVFRIKLGIRILLGIVSSPLLKN